MNPCVIDFAITAVTRKTGIQVRLCSQNSSAFELEPVGGHPNESFAIKFTVGWRSATTEVVWGSFSAPLINQMGTANPAGMALAAAFASAMATGRNTISMKINGIDFSPVAPETWPPDWRLFELQVKSPMQVINSSDLDQMKHLVNTLVIPVFGMAAALIGVEEDFPSDIGEPEGTPFQVTTTRYERQRLNREACIQLKGTKCLACDFDFEYTYGELGSGYIEIHHVVPVSKMGPEYQLSISADLVPLCSNCHSMVHRANPPLTVADLKKIIGNRDSDHD